MCDFCESKKLLTASFADLKIDSDVPFIDKACLTICNTRKSCPPFARCCDKDMNIEVHFDINYCPLCGKKLTHKKASEE